MYIAAMYLLSFLTMTAFLPIGLQTGARNQEATGREQVEVAMKKLWSPDESERVLGKEELFRLGPNAVPALLSLLEDIFANPTRHHYPTGKEAEGRAALESFDRESLSLKPRLTLQDLTRFEITWRLKSDAFELLGRLRSVEAIPLLIRIMESRDRDNLIEKIRPEMAALIELGSPAVPALLQSFVRAEETTSRITFGNPDTSEDSRRSYIEGETAKIKNRTAIVLGEIGDAQALPLLTAFLKQEKKLGFDSPYVRRAIGEIKNRVPVIR